MAEVPTYADLTDAYAVTRRATVRTPLLDCPALAAAAGAARVFVKAESFQVAGSFKFRGATWRIAQLGDAERARGVVAFSSGNFAQGLAAAGRAAGVPVTIVMPQDAPATKRQATEGFGARVVLSDHGDRPREEVAAALAREIAARDGLVLLHPFDDPAIGGTGKNEPILWTVNYGKGRVFHTALGHDVSAMQEPGFIATVVRGAEWAATGAVTIAAKLEPQAPRGSPRVLVVTGGHDHETTFYTMFESFAGMQVNVNPHPIAFNRDLRKDYDVLVLYDSVQTLDDKQKANLKAFVEDGGKGLVALHHSIVDFSDWEWWYRDVIGGVYLLKGRDGLPASTYKHDEELRIVPKTIHPILKGIGPMHLWDETYKHMWISPEVKVLLTTDNPTSDGAVAWVSPYPKTRVVFIQLGHGSTSHQHPGYRQLVENAILWSAGRIN